MIINLSLNLYNNALRRKFAKLGSERLPQYLVSLVSPLIPFLNKLLFLYK